MTDACASRICVLGMHRSGTSLLTEMLFRAGLELGQPWEILGPGTGNPHGHFENRRFTWINDRVLAAFDGSWHHPPAFPVGWLRDPRLDEPRRDALRLLASLSPEKPFGWKDPRNSLLVPFWRELVPELQFIIALRDPLAVAQSLERRDDFPFDRSSRLWFEYVRRAVIDTTGARRIFVECDELLRDSRDTSERLVAFCGLAPIAGELLEASVYPALHHHESEDLSFDREESIIPEASMLHLVLSRLVAQNAVELSEDMNRAVTAAVEAIDALSRTSELDAIGDRVRELEEAIEKKQRESSTLEQAIDAKQRESSRLEQLLAVRDEEARSLQDQVRTLQEVMQALEGREGEAAERERRLREEVATLEARANALQDLAAKSDEREKQAREEIDRVLPPGSLRRRAWDAFRRRSPGDPP